MLHFSSCRNVKNQNQEENLHYFSVLVLILGLFNCSCLDLAEWKPSPDFSNCQTSSVRNNPELQTLQDESVRTGEFLVSPLLSSPLQEPPHAASSQARKFEVMFAFCIYFLRNRLTPKVPKYQCVHCQLITLSAWPSLAYDGRRLMFSLAYIMASVQKS